eukprot:756093-Hanusia_phi.AAC.1
MCGRKGGSEQWRDRNEKQEREKGDRKKGREGKEDGVRGLSLVYRLIKMFSRKRVIYENAHPFSHPPPPPPPPLSDFLLLLFSTFALLALIILKITTLINIQAFLSCHSLSQFYLFIYNLLVLSYKGLVFSLNHARAT